MQMGLTPEQIEERRKYIGGTDAKRIMTGDWHSLWEEKTGRVSPEDLSDVFQVQLGLVTESFNLYWLEKTSPISITAYGKELGLVKDTDFPFMACHPDAVGYDEHGRNLLIDAKHSNAFNDDDGIIETYYWQMQHNAKVMQCSRICIPWIKGNSWPGPVYMDADLAAQAQMIDLEKKFWWHVENDIAPEQDEAPDVPFIPITDRKDYDYTGNNEWANFAVDYVSCQDAASDFDDAKKALKKLVPDDAKTVMGHGVEARVAKNGSVRFFTYEVEAAE